MVAPAVPLYKFQQKWISDKSRFKIACVSRQCGKSFMVSLEVALQAHEDGETWVLLSAGERQSKELMYKVRMHLEAISAAAASIEEDIYEAGDDKYTMLTIVLGNGGRIIGLPANPDTARGFTGNVVLDEFAFHRDSDKIWKALFPTVSRGYKLRIVSTPQGMGNRFHQLFTGSNNFSKHLVDIHQAVKDGVPHNIEELKEGIDDDDAWNQEYLCLFIDEASSWLSYELIASCQHKDIPGEILYDDFNLSTFKLNITGSLFGGVDIGRKHDHTIINIDELLGDVFWNRALIVVPKKKFQVQEDFIDELIQVLGIERTCIDSTGIGAQLAEDLVTKHGEHRVEEVPFTNPVKKDLAVRTKRVFEDHRTRIPICKKLRDDLHAVKKITTAAGNTRFDAERTKDGHSDRFWAKALTYMASDQPVIVPECIWM